MMKMLRLFRIVEHQARMRKIWKAIQRNEFEQDDLDHLKACFPWIGDKTSTEFKEFSVKNSHNQRMASPTLWNLVKRGAVEICILLSSVAVSPSRPDLPPMWHPMILVYKTCTLLHVIPGNKRQLVILCMKAIR